MSHMNPESGAPIPGRVAAIIPTHEHFDYAARTVASFARTAPGGLAVVVDDASPSWRPETSGDLRAAAAGCALLCHRFAENDGLTRSWNRGLAMARDAGCEVAVVTNADVLFTPGWWDTCRGALERGWQFVGPLTNAPGDVHRQGIGDYFEEYQPSDEAGGLSELAARVRTCHGEKVIEHRINGFWMAGRLRDWFAHRFDEEHVFDPSHRMVHNEVEFQRRARKGGARIGICLGMFVFHYRSVSRGPLVRAFSVGAYRPPSAIRAEH